MRLGSSFADAPLNTFRLPSFRAEHFPYSGPYPWLDLPDAEEARAGTAADNDPYRKIGAFCQILKHPGLLHWLGLLTERTPKPLQTIAGHKGSQQGVHSDSIHMTTYPLGYLTAAWIAFEDIHPDSGPLVY